MLHFHDHFRERLFMIGIFAERFHAVAFKHVAVSPRFNEGWLEAGVITVFKRLPVMRS